MSDGPSIIDDNDGTTFPQGEAQPRSAGQRERHQRIETHGVLGAATLLTACDSGGGGGSGVIVVPTPTHTPTPTPSPTPTTAVLTAQGASRFLAQATMGANRSSIDAVLNNGIAGWIDAQFARSRDTSHWDWLVSKNYNDATNSNNINGQNGYDPSVWRQAIAGGDPLRQRVALALLDFLVIGINGINLSWRAFAMAAYNDLLLDHAFGNYRDLLGAMSRNAAMGSFLSFIGSRKANASTGQMPDENYARELMQLFTLGVYQLEQDGSVRMSNGVPLETYTQDDVAQLARVFTGLNTVNFDNATPDRMRSPMQRISGVRRSSSARS